MPSDLERPFKHLISVLVLVKPTTTGTELNAVALPLPVILSQHLHAKANILPPSRIRGRETKSKNYDGTRTR